MGWKGWMKQRRDTRAYEVKRVRGRKDGVRHAGISGRGTQGPE